MPTAFGSTENVRTLAATLRQDIERSTCDEAGARCIVDEAVSAFQRHLALFDELAR